MTHSMAGMREGDAGRLAAQWPTLDDLTAKTLLVARDPELRTRIGRQARARAIHHTLDDVAAAYAATLEEVVRQHRARILPHSQQRSPA